MAAWMSGVWSLSSIRLTSAPEAISSAATAAWSWRLAAKSAEERRASRRLTLAPCWTIWRGEGLGVEEEGE
jgi:hypothetical protein